MTPPQRLKGVELYAWIGEDELGSGLVGIKQALVPAGMIPLVATQQEKMSRGSLIQAMGMQAEAYNKKIYLCRFVFDGVKYSTLEGEPLA
jgi:hypothetical protein